MSEAHDTQPLPTGESGAESKTEEILDALKARITGDGNWMRPVFSRHEYESALNELSQHAKSLESEVSRLTRENDEQRTKIIAMGGEWVSLCDQRDALESKVDTLTRENRELRESQVMDALRNMMAPHRVRIQELLREWVMTRTPNQLIELLEKEITTHPSAGGAGNSQPNAQGGE